MVKKADKEVTKVDEADEAKKVEQAELRKSLNEAKVTLFAFMETDTFKALEDAVKTAIKRLAKKATASGATATTHGMIKSLFTEVGQAINEFELFKTTKMGRAEMRQKVFYAMSKCDPTEKHWVRFDEPTESWVLDGIGADMPDNWTEEMLPKSRAKTA